MGGKRFGRGGGKGGQEASRSADSAATKPAATETAGGPAAGTSTSSDLRRVDPLREGVNAWFKAAGASVLRHEKLVDLMDQEHGNMHNGGFWLGEPVGNTEEVINVFPGAERKLLRAAAMARLTERNKWGAYMWRANSSGSAGSTAGVAPRE